MTTTPNVGSKPGLKDLLTRSGPPSWAPAVVLALIFVALATAYNLKVPVYEAPDETGHIGYVDALQRTWAIPELTPETYEAIGPPLYHGLAAGILWLFDLTPPLVEIPRNPLGTQGPPQFIHDPAIEDPQSAAIRSIHVVRGVSTLFGAGTVILVYLIALLMFPAKPHIAWGAGAMTALLPQFAFIGGAAGNDTAVAFFASATVYSSLRLMKGGDLRWAVWAALSISLGLLTEISLALVVPIAFAALLISPLSRKQQLTGICALVALPLAIAGWFYIRNLINWGDVYPPSLVAAPGSALPLTHPVYRARFLEVVTASYWYRGGWLNLSLAEGIYQLLDFVIGMALGGLLIMAIRDKLSVFQQRSLALLVALAILGFLQIIAISVRVGFAPQGRYLFIAQPAIAILLIAGVTALLEGSPARRVSWLALPVVLFLMNAVILLHTIPKAY